MNSVASLFKYSDIMHLSIIKNREVII